METYISLLRGINVSGSKMIKMDQLKHLYLTLNFTAVETYIQSGNVIFRSAQTEVHILENLISETIKIQFGFEVPVVVLSLETLGEILNNNPFLQKDPDVISTHLYVTLLKDLPIKALTDKLVQDESSSEQFVISNQAIYLFLPDGYGNARRNNNFFETRLKTPATTRNWKTLNTLADMAEKASLLSVSPGISG